MNADPRFSLENPQYVQGLDLAHDAERSRASTFATNLEQAEYDAIHDPLTNTLNRRGLDEQLNALDAAGVEVAILFVDGDHIKNINDALDHAAGDRAIIGIADTLRGCTRPEDIVARIGGDEFVIILSKNKRDANNELGLEQIVTNTTERLKQCVSDFQSKNTDLRDNGFDLSVGAAIRKPGDDFKDTKAEADARMYEHKQRQEKVSSANQQALMAELAGRAIAAGISPRAFASFMRSYQPEELSK